MNVTEPARVPHADRPVAPVLTDDADTEGIVAGVFLADVDLVVRVLRRLEGAPRVLLDLYEPVTRNRAAAP